MNYMIKKDLREAGFAETEKHQKTSMITAIWVLSTLAMIALVFVFTILLRAWKSSGSEFFDLLDDMAFMLNRIFQQWRFAVYLLLWAIILLTLFFATKRDLREQKRSAPPKAQKRFGKYILRSIVVLLIIVAFCYLLTLVAEVPEQPGRATSGGDIDLLALVFGLLSFIGPFAILVYLFFWELLYLVVKLIATRFVCHDKKSSIKLQILKGTAMPVCSCREAVSLSHILVTYLIPFVFMYSVLLGMCAAATDGQDLVMYTIAAIFMSFFMSYDLTLVVYAIYLKIRYKMDYISIDHHIYEVTLFKKSYLKTANKQNFPMILNKLHRY